MSLLPPQFQTHLPHTLGAKITAMPAPPKPPHVHQWVAVPDSKIHSRCAECGTVTLTEIVAPKPAAFTFIPNDGLTQMIEEMSAMFGVIFKPYPATRHYTSIVGLDGKVRMVETDAEGWIKNDGTQPVAGDVRVECRLRAEQSKGVAPADEWGWSASGTEWSIAYWRPAA